jgi:hypothetical protein
MSYAISEAAALVAAKYAAMVSSNKALSPAEITTFLQIAGMNHEPMHSLSPIEWLKLLKAHGLLWVGTLGVASPGTYLHSRILEGMLGNGEPNATWMKIIDPETGLR